jgi:hypothetical protein
MGRMRRRERGTDGMGKKIESERGDDKKVRFTIFHSAQLIHTCMEWLAALAVQCT